MSGAKMQLIVLDPLFFSTKKFKDKADAALIVDKNAPKPIQKTPKCIFMNNSQKHNFKHIYKPFFLMQQLSLL